MSRIHFQRLEVERDRDAVIVWDGQGNEMHVFEGGYPSGLWSFPIPGRELRVQLLSNGATTGWGFCADQIATTEMPTCLIESEHPYANDYRNSWTITNPNPDAQQSMIHFAFLDVEEPWDPVTIADGADNEIQRIVGFHAQGLWSAPVPGRTVKIGLSTDGSSTRWGLCVDRIVTLHSTYLPITIRQYP